MPELLFWLNIPSIHLAPLIRETARLWHETRGGGVRVICEAGLPPERAALGWPEAEFGAAPLTISAEASLRDQHLRGALGQENVHLFSGIDAYPATFRTLKQVLRSPARAGVILERPRGDDGLRAQARAAKYTLLAQRFGGRLDWLLAIGSGAQRFFIRVGFPEDRIHPFAYVTDFAPLAPAAARQSDRVQLGYLGQFVSRKGVDLLLAAAGKISSGGWQLNLIGDGPERTRLGQQADALGLSGVIDWPGILPRDEARARLVRLDALILPSRHDGWGAVVNEALQAGTPVIVSDGAGASELASDPVRGRVFPSGDSDALAAILRQTVEAGPLSPTRRTSIRDWADQALSAEAAARYLLTVLDSDWSEPVTPPWR